MGRLLLDELLDLVRAWARAPALVMVVSGLVAAAGLYVALGSGYPGPVAPQPLRWAMVLAVVVVVAVIVRTVPPTWRKVRSSVLRARAMIAVVSVAGVVSLIKVGLHDTTPGPVLPAAGRWTAVVMLAGLVFLVVGRTNARR